jgi:hypothetical protein
LHELIPTENNIQAPAGSLKHLIIEKFGAELYEKTDGSADSSHLDFVVVSPAAPSADMGRCEQSALRHYATNRQKVDLKLNVISIC